MPRLRLTPEVKTSEPVVFKPTHEQRHYIKHLVIYGATHAQMAQLLGITEDVLKEAFALELDVGMVDLNAQIQQSLFRRAIGQPEITEQRVNAEGKICEVTIQPARDPDLNAIQWWEKTRRGMRDYGNPQPPAGEAPPGITNIQNNNSTTLIMLPSNGRDAAKLIEAAANPEAPPMPIEPAGPTLALPANGRE